MIPEDRRARWGAARRVLAVRLDGMGDFLMTTPALRALKSEPGRHLSALTSPAGAAAARLVPEVDAVIEYRAPWMKGPTGGGPEQFNRLVDELRSSEFDAAVVFGLHTQNVLPAALACYLAGIPLRLARCRENPYALLSDWLPETETDPPKVHDVRRQLDLCAAVGARTPDESLSLRVPEEARDSVMQWFPLSDPWAVIHPGATASSRRYPVEGFAEAASELASDHGWRFVITGAPDERPLTHRLKSLIGDAGELAADLTFAQLAALIEQAPVLITNNTGPAHIAAAVCTPVVDLYALTNPQHTPWQVPARVLSHDVPCKNCYRSVCPEGHQACLRGVAPKEIVKAALSLTAAPNRRTVPGISYV